MSLEKTDYKSEKLLQFCQNQDFETDFLKKVSLKILYSLKIMKTFTCKLIPFHTAKQKTLWQSFIHLKI